MPADDKASPKISLTQTMAGALAAVTSAVVGSRLGIAGTLVGAAAGSVVASLGSALYSSWIHRTATRVRTVVPVVRRGTGPTGAETSSGSHPADQTELDALAATAVQPQLESTTVLPAAVAPDLQPEPSVGRRIWRPVAIATLAVFAVSLAVITGFEAVVGSPISSLFGGDDGTGTTIGRVVREPAPPATEPVPTLSTPSEEPTTAPSSEVSTTTPDETTTQATTEPTTPTPTSTPPTTTSATSTPPTSEPATTTTRSPR